MSVVSGYKILMNNTLYHRGLKLKGSKGQLRSRGGAIMGQKWYEEGGWFLLLYNASLQYS